MGYYDNFDLHVQQYRSIQSGSLGVANAQARRLSGGGGPVGSSVSSFGIGIGVSGLDQVFEAMRFIGKVQLAYSDPSVWTPAIRNMGVWIDDNFRNESSPDGQWKSLSGRTRTLRKKRGYPQSHPILDQSGQLRELAAGQFMGWRTLGRNGIPAEATSPYTNPETRKADTLIFIGSQHDMWFTASIQGDRVENQKSRPFWALNNEALSDIAGNLMNGINIAWASLSGSAVKLSGTFPSKTGLRNSTMGRVSGSSSLRTTS